MLHFSISGGCKQACFLSRCTRFRLFWLTLDKKHLVNLGKMTVFRFQISFKNTICYGRKLLSGYIIWSSPLILTHTGLHYMSIKYSAHMCLNLVCLNETHKMFWRSWAVCTSRSGWRPRRLSVTTARCDWRQTADHMKSGRTSNASSVF